MSVPKLAKVRLERWRIYGFLQHLASTTQFPLDNEGAESYYQGITM